MEIAEDYEQTRLAYAGNHDPKFTQYNCLTIICQSQWNILCANPL